jgi:hypothetical protein
MHREVEMHTKCWSEMLKVRDHLVLVEDNIKIINCEVMEWIELTQDKVQWRSLVKT